MQGRCKLTSQTAFLQALERYADFRVSLFHLVSAMFANTRRIENPPNICNRLHIVFIAETNGKWNCKIKQAQKDTFFKTGPRFEETNK
jgi:hypothetical protein